LLRRFGESHVKAVGALQLVDAAVPLVKLFESSARHHWGRHQVLFRADGSATNLHKITSGAVAISMAMSGARRQIVAFLFTGDICGFALSDGRYGFDCEAISRTTTCTISMSRVHELTISDPDVAEALERRLSRAYNRVAEHLVAVGQLDAKERVVYFLRRLCQSYTERGMPAAPLQLPMTRLDIADHLGMRFETLSRALTQLKGRHLIDLPDANTVVLNDRMINRFAGTAVH
jgi:CRP-like cAMP-binding protein